MKSFTLYGLKSSDESCVRYIGITSQPIEARLRGHLKTDRSNPHKDRWIKKVISTGARVEIVPYAIGLPLEEACNLEIFVIAQLRGLNHPLTNISNGGESVMLGRIPFFSSEHKRNISQAKLGVPRNPFSSEHRKNLSQALIGNDYAAGKKRKGASSKFRGVSWLNCKQRWRAFVFVNPKLVYVGTFKNEVDAAHAYDTAAKKYFGDRAKLNFPNP